MIHRNIWQDTAYQMIISTRRLTLFCAKFGLVFERPPDSATMWDESVPPLANDTFGADFDMFVCFDAAEERATDGDERKEEYGLLFFCSLISTEFAAAAKFDKDYWTISTHWINYHNLVYNVLQSIFNECCSISISSITVCLSYVIQLWILVIVNLAVCAVWGQSNMQDGYQVLL